MDVQSSLLRFDSWSRPSLKDMDILRTLSVEAQDDFMAALNEQRPISAEVITETVATLSTSQRGTSSDWKHKRVVQIDVQCTPGSAFEDIIRQLENPSLPTFKLIDLPVDAKEDLYRLASPGAPGFESGAPVGEEQPPLRQQLSRLPFPGLDGKGGKFSFAQASYEMGPSSLMASISQDMSLGPHEPWIDVAGDRQIAVGGGGSPAQEISVTSDDRPMKRARTGSLDDDFGVDSGTDTGGSAAMGRSKRMTCLKCGTHQTPQWRMGPDGPRTMCNACGVKYKKELKEREKKAKEQRAKHAVLSSESESQSDS